ncbi:MAG: branched-chain amino acid ABC transporter substrate-binding protein [Thiopseudomonas sp.]|jgi:branched-chain amino acid transport system substrate-binding protein|uniref:branched-chain amino acid ABC transporter substrate-binding protein n=1 Tax=Denitrificimonas caeni TaxID=521720 RepID=UPI0003B39B3C|nr:branched-chain amino acid ABC transporter substrate-binding protein [Denitrificimonas caeni]MBP7959125.1 branched-chain amino acid ABC transporter substrate-binding protein [Thiopseudomonas sp.]HHX05423.1 branched-chain amino acid ABC transporter substrate-binding protein [Pseudomonas sp.]MBP8008318.1 branched-chain amino acid ABC transporter substrate-binding protein [Thiopseudomonas sp.]MBP8771270.1 branched-chain amino acid ABC transporter substrate-binding protein [Thiopseudomonas sp.]M
MSKTTQRISTLFAAMALAGVASYSLAAEPIKIALAGPVTGPVAQYGDMQSMGALMAIEQINKAGGVNGSMLEAVTYDDACDPKQAVAVANKIVNDGIQFVVGHLCSGSSQPAADIYDEEGIMMITAASTAPELTEKGHTLIFRTIGLDTMQGPTAGNYVVEQLKPKRAAILHDKQQYGEGIATSVKKALDDAKIPVVLFEGVTAGDKDFSALIAKLKKEDVDFVYFGGYHPEMGMLLRQSAENKFSARFMGPEGVGNSDISAIAGDASEGMLVTLPKAFDEDPKNAHLVAAFKAKKQDPRGAFVFPAYAAVQVMADAMTISKSQDPEKVAQALRSNSFDTPTGVLEFDDKGDLKNFSFVVYEWHADGSKTALTE